MRHFQYQANNILTLVFWAILCLLFSALSFRAGTLPFKNYTTADGLAHDFVSEIVRDSRGFLWFCTGEGLSRFDGYEFKNYTQAHGLPNRSVNDLLEIENGIYLVATADGIAVFDPKGDAKPNAETPMFRTFRVPWETSDQRPIEIFALHKTRGGQILAATIVGLYRVLSDGREWRFERAGPPAWGDAAREVIAINEDRFDRLWMGVGGEGVLVFNPENGEVFPVLKKGGLSIIEDNDGRMWADGSLSPEKTGLHLFDLPGKEERPVLLRSFTKADGLSDNVWIHSLAKTSDGRVLAAIRNGLNEFLPEARAGEPAFRQLFLSNILSAGEDAGGNLWVGTSTRGVFKLTRRGFELFEMTEKPPYTGITSIFPGGSGGEIFVTSSDADLLRFDGRKFSEIQLTGAKARSWGRSQLDLRSRVDGEWWIPSAFGLVRYAPVEKFEDLARAKPKKIYTIADGLFGNAIFNMFEDSRGDLWFSMMGSGKDNLGRWERQSDKIVGYTTDDGLTEYNAATAFAEDAGGNLWLGFYAGGAARFRNGRFQTFSARSGFPTGYVSAIYSDRRGRLWMATSNSGLLRFDNPLEDEPQYTVLNVGNGLSSNQTNCITEDNFGRIYVGTARGLSRIEPETGRIRLYTQADGLPGNSIGRCARDPEGNLWFSQKFTLARLRVERDEKSEPPPVFIGSLRVNGADTAKLSELGETAVDNLEFSSDQRQIQITFFALGFGTGERLLYQYKLDGTGADWSEPSGQRTIDLNLAPGSYRFLVRAVNAEGVTSENPARISFVIARPIWLRWWVLLLAALAVSAIVYVIYRNRIAQIIKLERVRTRIATDLHDDIGSSLSKIAILSEVVRQKNGAGAGGNGHFEPLEIIANTSRAMVDSMSDIVWAINPERDHLADLVQRMRHFAEEMLDAADIDYEFSDAENLKNITLGADLRREVYLIFKECVNNLAKHSGATRAEFEIRLEKECLIIEIEDNGRGFETAELRAETSSAYSADIGGDGAARSFGGNGLRNMRRRAQNLGGAFVIDSEPGQGTRIVLKAPVG